MGKIGLFFGPLDGAVNSVADKIVEALGDDVIELIPVKNASGLDLAKYEKIIFGISTIGKDTWDSEFSSNDWAKFLPVIDENDFTNKKIAIFGLGDHVTYASYFVDSMGLLARKLVKQNATIVGQVATDGYEFNESEAVIDGVFIGLPLDEDFEPELTEARLQKWLKNLKSEFSL